MASRFQVITEDPDRERKAFKVFSSAYREREVYDDWTKDVFPAAVAANINIPGGQEELRILGVGSGTGEMDCSMLDKLLLSFPRIHNRVVEPSKDYVVQYEKLAASKAHELQGVTFDWRQQTIEEYENTRDSTKFHFISANHSLYHVKDLRHSLLYMYDLLEPDGVLLVIILSDDSGACRFLNHFKSICKKHVSSAHIRGILDLQGIPYTSHHQRIGLQMDITDCFNEGSEDGGLLLDFIIQVVKFRGTASADLQARVMEYLGDCSEKATDNKTYLGIDHDAIVIKKPVIG